MEPPPTNEVGFGLEANPEADTDNTDGTDGKNGGKPPFQTGELFAGAI